jgi:hypothetical protein
MKIEKKEIAGLPIKQVREILRDLRSPLSGDLIRTREEIAERAGSDITDALVAEGLLEPFSPSANDGPELRCYAEGGPYFRITRAGIGVTAARLLKRIDRARADLYGSELIARADAINADPQYAR